MALRSSQDQRQPPHGPAPRNDRAGAHAHRVGQAEERLAAAVDAVPQRVGTQSASQNAKGRLGSTGRPSCIYLGMLGFRVVELGGIEPPTS